MVCLFTKSNSADRLMWFVENKTPYSCTHLYDPLHTTLKDKHCKLNSEALVKLILLHLIQRLCFKTAISPHGYYNFIAWLHVSGERQKLLRRAVKLVARVKWSNSAETCGRDMHGMCKHREIWTCPKFGRGVDKQGFTNCLLDDHVKETQGSAATQLSLVPAQLVLNLASCDHVCV